MSFTFGKVPCWRDPFFADILLDGFLPAQPADVTSFSVMDHSSDLLSQVLDNVVKSPDLMSCFERDDVAHVHQAATAVREVREFAARIPQDPNNAQELRDFLGHIVTRIRSMRAGESIILPAGWFKGDRSAYLRPTRAPARCPRRWPRRRGSPPRSRRRVS